MALTYQWHLSDRRLSTRKCLITRGWNRANCRHESLSECHCQQILCALTLIHEWIGVNQDDRCHREKTEIFDADQPLHPNRTGAVFVPFTAHGLFRSAIQPLRRLRRKLLVTASTEYLSLKTARNLKDSSGFGPDTDTE